MGGFKRIETEIDEIIRDVYFLGDFSTPLEFKQIVYAKCNDKNMDTTYRSHVDKRVYEVLYELD